MIFHVYEQEARISQDNDSDKNKTKEMIPHIMMMIITQHMANVGMGVVIQEFSGEELVMVTVRPGTRCVSISTGIDRYIIGIG